jgi:hypothetical protein
MPNWCTTILQVEFQDEATRQTFIDKMTYSDRRSRIVRQSTKLLCAGLVGLLRPARDVPANLPEPKVAGASYGKVKANPIQADHAYSDLLDVMTTEPLTDDATLDRLEAIYSSSGLSDIGYEDLPGDAQALFASIAEVSGSDWQITSSLGVAVDPALAWSCLEDATSVEKEQNGKLWVDFYRFIPLPLLSELGGYNASLLRTLPGYRSCDIHFGDRMNAVHCSFCFKDLEAVLKFDTAWDPPSSVIEAMYGQLGLTGKACHFEEDERETGLMVFEDGERLDCCDDEIEFSDDDDDEDEGPERLGPEFLIEAIDAYVEAKSWPSAAA